MLSSKCILTPQKNFSRKQTVKQYNSLLHLGLPQHFPVGCAKFYPRRQDGTNLEKAKYCPIKHFPQFRLLLQHYFYCIHQLYGVLLLSKFQSINHPRFSLYLSIFLRYIPIGNCSFYPRFQIYWFRVVDKIILFSFQLCIY